MRPTIAVLLAWSAATAFYVCSHLEGTRQWVDLWAPRLAEVLPRGFVPAPPSGTSIFGPEAISVPNELPPYAAAFLLWHLAVCFVLLWAYRVYGFPQHLGAGRSVSLRAIRGRVVVVSAWLSVLWPGLAHLSHVLWWSMKINPLLMGIASPPLAIGTFGVLGIRLAAVSAHLLTISWAIRWAVLAKVNREEVGFFLCPGCSYQRRVEEPGPCPECGRSRRDDDVRPAFAFGKHLMRISLSRWRLPSRIGMIAVVVALYCAPLTLSLLGGILPVRVMQAIGDWWYRLF